MPSYCNHCGRYVSDDAAASHECPPTCSVCGQEPADPVCGRHLVEQIDRLLKRLKQRARHERTRVKAPSKIVKACAALVRASYDLPSMDVGQRDDLRALAADAIAEYDRLRKAAKP